MSGTAWNRPTKALPLASAALPLLLLPVAILFAVHRYLLCGASFNSDNLYCASFCRDVLAGRTLRGWHLPGAPYLFPDIALLLPCQALSDNVVVVFAAYGLAFYGLLAAALAWLGRQAGLGRRPAVAAAGAGTLLLAATLLGEVYYPRAVLASHPGNHLGAILLGLALLGLLAGAVRRGRWGLAPAALLVAGGGLGGVSDKLLFVQFLAPAGLALLLLAARRAVPLRLAALTAGLLAAALVLALALRAGLAGLGFHLLRVEGDFGDPLRPEMGVCLRTLWASISRQTTLHVLGPVYLAAALVLALVSPRGVADQKAEGRRQKAETRGRGSEFSSRGPSSCLLPSAYCLLPSGPGPAPAFVGLTLLLIPACNLAAVVAAGMTTNPALDRYVLACYLLPFLTLGLLLRLLPWRPARAGAALLGVWACAAAVWHAGRLLPGVSPQEFAVANPPLARALVELAGRRGPLYGLGSFWAARHLTYLTGGRAVVACVHDATGPWFHADNPDRFLHPDPRDLRLPEYRFVVVAGEKGQGMDLDPVVAEHVFGTPRRRLAVDGREIWLYDRLEHEALRRFLLARLAERARRCLPWQGPQAPACLSRPRDNLTPPDAARVVPLEAGGALDVRFPGRVTGPVIDFAAGAPDHYLLTFSLQGRDVGRLHVPSVPWAGAAYGPAGLQARLLAVPAALRAAGWDRVQVRPLGAGKDFRVGHLLVYQQDLPPGTLTPPPGRPRRYEGEDLFTPLDPDASRAADPAASNGGARRAPASFAGTVSFGPYTYLAPGRYRVDFALAAEGDGSAGKVAEIDVLVGGRDVVVRRELTGEDFPGPGRYARHSLLVDSPGGLDLAEFRLSSAGRIALRLDYVEVTPLSPEPLPAGTAEACEAAIPNPRPGRTEP
jgi:hypothetical protein